ncbi:MAG: type IV secretion system protein VirB9 [Methylotenera sp.]|nr:MAG: type IV secretion system protein VirB9 [Methylotenera sp.]
MKFTLIKKEMLAAVLSMLVVHGHANGLAVDHKVQFVPYDKNKATLIKAKRGFATHIKLDSNEGITEVAGGDSANWNVSASKGNNDLFLSPKSTAHDTNMVVATNKRHYVFDLRVLNNNAPEQGIWYLAFTYENAPDSAAMSAVSIPTKAQIAKTEQASIQALAAESPVLKNTQYSMQIMPNSDGIAPKSVGDDGNFTYLYLPHHREIPAVFSVAADGRETMVNTHMDGDNSDTMVIHGVAKHFVLRLDTQVVGVWNEAYDIDGGSPRNGTVIPHVSRKVVE